MKKTYKTRTGNVEAMQFPDSGPEQHGVKKWIESKGGELHLYDGNVVQDVKTSTGANWRWECGSLAGTYANIYVGDWVVFCLDNKLRVFKNESFEKLFILDDHDKS